jgi:hypothetical protein
MVGCIIAAYSCMRVDDAFRNWWNKRSPQSSLPCDAVIPIDKNLQGHPEGPRQWSIHIDRILHVHFGLMPTTHAPCLYSGVFQGHRILFLRQVNDFAIACADRVVYDAFCDELDKHLSIPITRHGLMQHYYGVDIVQTVHYISILVKLYLQQVLQSHGWDSLTPVSLPMKAVNEHVHQLDHAKPLDHDAFVTVEKTRFRYRSAIGELIWPMICAGPDIAFATVKLSHFSSAPAVMHYEALFTVFCYLADKLDYAIVYTQPALLDSLPSLPLPHVLHTDNAISTPSHNPHHLTNVLYGYCDADWAMDVRHRRSISGVVLKLAGVAIAWKTCVQPTILLSTTKAEFLAACNAGRMVLYLRSVLAELGYELEHATTLFEDNRGSMLMLQASQPTRQTCHIDIRNFAFLQCIDQDLLQMVDIESAANVSNILTKQTPKPTMLHHLQNLLGLLLLHFSYGCCQIVAVVFS